MGSKKQSPGIFNVNVDQFNPKKQMTAMAARRAAAANRGAQFDETAEIKAPTAEEKKVSTEQRQKIDAIYPFTSEYIPLDKLCSAPDEWNFFPAQNAEMISELVGNIALYGQTTPARVWKQADGTYMILGGHTRFQALKTLHELYQTGEAGLEQDFDTMWCSVYDTDTIDEVEARKIVIYDNLIRRENSTAIKARSVITMAQLERDTRSAKKIGERRTRVLENVAAIMNENIGTIKRIYQLRNLIPEFWPLVDAKDRDERVTNQFARDIAMLSPELQKYIYDKALYKNRITPQIRAGLKKVQDANDIDELFAAPEIFTISAKTELTEPIPDHYEPIMLFAAPNEIEKIKSLIEWYVCESGEISDETKNLLRKVFAKKHS